MKKIVSMFATILLGALISTTVFAETNPDVWSETTIGNDHTISIEVDTNGNATDGVIEIKYDASVVSCTEGDVKVADTVDMHSVNVQTGSVKISFLAENAIKEGAFVTIPFKAVKEGAAEEELKAALSFSGVAHDEDGAEVVVLETANGVPVTPGDGEEQPDNGDGSGSGSQGASGNNNSNSSANVQENQISTSTTSQVAAKTGDNANFTLIALIIGFGCVAVAAGAKKKLSH